MRSFGSRDRSCKEGCGLKVIRGSRARSGTFDAGAPGTGRKVVDEVARVDPTTHCERMRRFRTLALREDVREFLTSSKNSAIQQREGSHR